jgi:hypothetical protein
MARKKVTVLVDQEKLKQAQELTGSRSLSATIDLALSRLIREEETRRDVEIYLANPPTDDEFPSRVPVKLDLGDDDVDYDAMYPPSQGDDRDEHGGDDDELEYIDYEGLRALGYRVPGPRR